MSTFNLLKARLAQGHRTQKLPSADAHLPERYRGRPVLNGAKCPPGCDACATACPTGAVTVDPLRVDLGACLFCPACGDACGHGALRYGSEWRMARRRRDELIADGAPAAFADALEARARKLFRRSLKLREVSAGGCNGCEVEINVTGTVVFDLGRFGIQFVASPRHADGLVITGPVTANMRQALLDTWDATPSPRIAIAVGSCAIAGGPFAGSPHCLGIPAEIPIDLFIPGCPPHPWTFVDGLLRLLGR